VHEVSFKSGNETIYGIFIHTAAACTPTDTLILYCHGKSDHIDNYWPRARMLYDQSSGSHPVLIFDYRGYGKSTGETTEEGLYEDAAAALAYVRTNLGDPQVFIYGYSVGSVAGCKIAEEQCLLATTDPLRRITGMALEAPIGKIGSIVTDATYLNIPGSALTTYDADNRERIRNVEVPLLWLHGTDDETLSMETHGQPIWDNYTGGDGACVKVDGGGHADLPEVMTGSYTRYKSIVRNFIRGTHRDNVNLYTEFNPALP
jgi:pimeloyl-ACP methyl ester carboxylesterase